MEIKKEIEIISKIGKDRSQFKQLYKEYAEDVYRYLYSINSNREIAEDLVSQTFLVALEKIESYEPRGISVKYWLISIARNLSLDSFRKSKWLNDAYEVSEEIDLDPTKPLPSDHNLDIDVAKYLSLLPVQTREIIILKIWEEYTFKEIGKLINESENTVKTQFYRGLEKIKRDMDKEGFSKGFAIFPIIWSQIDRSKGQYKFSNDFNMENIKDLDGTPVSSSSKFLKYFAISLVVLVTFLLLTGLFFVLFESRDDEPKPVTNAVNETDDSEVADELNGEEEDSTDQVEDPIDTTPELYSYKVDLYAYSGPGGGPLDSITTIEFKSLVSDLEVIEVGSQDAGNLTDGLVGFTTLGNEDLEVKFDIYYEGFGQSFDEENLFSVGTNPHIKGQIWYFYEEGWNRYMSNISLTESCYATGPDTYAPPCGNPILSIASSDSEYIGMACRNDITGSTCDEIILNITSYVRVPVN